MPEDEFYNFRERLLADQRIYEQEQNDRRELEQRKAEELQRRRLLNLEGGSYFEELSVKGNHLAVSSQWFIPQDLSLPENWGNWGVEYLSAFSFKKKTAKAIGSEFLLYLGLSGSYINTNNSRGLLLASYISPFLSQGLKFGNLVFLIGLDGGGALLFLNQLSQGITYGVSGGALANIEIKIFKRFGLFTGLKADYLVFPQTPNYSGWNLRLLSGLVF
ncbi:hypothetical protein ES703_116625 [subsurface metagenome]